MPSVPSYPTSSHSLRLFYVVFSVNLCSYRVRRDGGVLRSGHASLIHCFLFTPFRRFCHLSRDNRQSAHGVETEKEVFDELLNYGRQALDRFSSIVDTTSRYNIALLYDASFIFIPDSSRNECTRRLGHFVGVRVPCCCVGLTPLLCSRYTH